ncbi:MAG: hypothetical protein H7306_12630 [Bacteriovorax sp.]|nr:hypothetical protein [Rhizobacter sp.]
MPQQRWRIGHGPAIPNAAALGVIAAMTRIVLGPRLRRFTEVPEKNVPADPLRAALDDPFRPDSDGHVLQALSGGRHGGWSHG